MAGQPCIRRTLRQVRDSYYKALAAIADDRYNSDEVFDFISDVPALFADCESMLAAINPRPVIGEDDLD